MENQLKFNLEVDKIEDQLNNQTQCKFRLFWGKNQKVSSKLISYPFSLINEDKSKNSDYYQWRRLYKQYYQQLHEIEKLNQENQLNIEKLEKKISKKRKNLQQYESILVNNFNDWLNDDLLSPVYDTIIKEINQINTNSTNENNKNNQINLRGKDSVITVNIFITCNCRELERLPWEKWQLKGISNVNLIKNFIKIRIIRSPNNIHSASAKLRNKPARILAIFGDSTGLNFDKENQLLSSLNSLVKKLEIISWNKNKYQSIAQWRSKICHTIADNQGWDMLFFFGHSEEDNRIDELGNTGGYLGIAPHEYIPLKDIKPYLTEAQDKGLQFALFNSCSGLDIANSLIGLGLNQVVIMREPLPDMIAPVFFQEFLAGLAKQKNVADVLQETCEILNPNTQISNSNSKISTEKINYPSAYLIPSLFGHPNASFYQLKPFGWKAKLTEWLPNKKQTLAISCLSLISLFPFVQEFLLDKRLFTQAIYRDFTQQIPDNFSPPITLISIDEESLSRGNITQRYPLDRKYLAQIIDRLTQLNAQNISIDYLLDLPQQNNDPILAKSIKNAREKNGTSFIFGSITQGEQEVGILSEIASLNTVMQSSIEASSTYHIPLPDNCHKRCHLPDNCHKRCPFAYLTALYQKLPKTNINNNNFSLEQDYKTQVLNYFDQISGQNLDLNFLKKVNISPITKISQYFGQHWLEPIVDYSLPPNTIYQVIPAWQLLENNDNFVNNEINLTNLQILKNKVFLIASGGYKEAGIDGDKDYFSLPLATKFWHKKDFIYRETFTGGEVNAYMIHHWLTQHLIIPIPDLWLILVAGLLAKSIEKYLLSFNNNGKNLLLKLPNSNLKLNIYYLLITANLIYFGLSLQIYITLNLILPIILPSLSFWTYFLFRSKNYENS